MRKKLLLAIIVLLSVNLLHAEIKFESLTLEKAKAKAEKQGKFLFIDVYASWCGPCKYLEQNIFSDEELGEFFNKHFICLRVDGEQPEGVELMTEFALDAYPTMIFMDGNGKMLRKRVGVLSVDELTQLGKDMASPESSAYFQVVKKFEAGARDRKFMQEYIRVMADEEMDLDEVLEQYAEKHKDLDLMNEAEFIVFTSKVHDMGNPLMVTYLKQVEKYDEKYGNYTEKMAAVLDHYLAKAVAAKDLGVVTKVVPELHAAWEKTSEDEIYSESELTDLVEEVYRKLMDQENG